MKTALTLKQEELIYKAVNAEKIGLYSSFEVAVKEDHREYIDFMTMDSNETIRCYEIKSSMEDFKSKAAKTFIGDYNYYVMPSDLYEKIKNELEWGVGVYITEGNTIKRIKNSRRKTVYSYERHYYCHAMIRSMAKYVKLYMKERIERSNQNAEAENQ